MAGIWETCFKDVNKEREMREGRVWSDILSEDGRWDSLMMHPPSPPSPPVYSPEPNRVPALTHGISFQLDTKSQKNAKAKSLLNMYSRRQQN
jgi:hypothetical protein